MVLEYECGKCGRKQASIKELAQCIFCHNPISSPRRIGESVLSSSNPTRLSSKAEMPTDGPSLWLEWHSYKWKDLASFLRFIDEWLIKVDKLPGCACSKDFRTIILPRFRFDDITTDEAWFVRSWEVHNAVNKKLGKIEFALEDAIDLYRPKGMTNVESME